MACQGKLYANTDVDITISICDPATLDISDINSMSMTLTHNITGSSVTINSTNGEIEITASAIKALISKTHITAAGRYNLKLSFVDGAGKTRGLTPNPDFLVFY